MDFAALQDSNMSTERQVHDDDAISICYDARVEVNTNFRTLTMKARISTKNLQAPGQGLRSSARTQRRHLLSALTVLALI